MYLPKNYTNSNSFMQTETLQYYNDQSNIYIAIQHLIHRPIRDMSVFTLNEILSGSKTVIIKTIKCPTYYWLYKIIHNYKKYRHKNIRNSKIQIKVLKCGSNGSYDNPIKCLYM